LKNQSIPFPLSKEPIRFYRYAGSDDDAVRQATHRMRCSAEG
jgi:hypothetical protein